MFDCVVFVIKVVKVCGFIVNVNVIIFDGYLVEEIVKFFDFIVEFGVGVLMLFGYVYECVLD